MPDPAAAPRRAFAQGVGTVFQFAGVILFLVSSCVCCSSALLSKDWATKADRTHIGWRFGRDAAAPPLYSLPQAITLSVSGAVVLGISVAALGLGLQVQCRGAATGAVVAAAVGLVFWIVQTVFFIHPLRSVPLAAAGGLLALLFLALLVLAVGALAQMLADPPSPGDYEPTTDTPDAAMAREVQKRRRRLDIEQKEVEAMEARLRRKDRGR